MPNFELGEKQDFHACLYNQKRYFLEQQKFHYFPENWGFGGNSKMFSTKPYQNVRHFQDSHKRIKHIIDL